MISSLRRILCGELVLVVSFECVPIPEIVKIVETGTHGLNICQRDKRADTSIIVGEVILETCRVTKLVCCDAISADRVVDAVIACRVIPVLVRAKSMLNFSPAPPIWQTPAPPRYPPGPSCDHRLSTLSSLAKLMQLT
jgi:hypothetical protein